MLTACGGGGEDVASTEGDGGIIGTAKIIVKSTDEVKAKSKSGNSYKAKIASTGQYHFKNLKSDSYLLKTKSGNTDLYSIAYITKGKSARSNIHSITDLIIRNWFKQQGKDIDAEFKGSNPISKMPSIEDINAIETAIQGILSEVLKESGVKESVNLVSQLFELKADDKFNQFLDKNQVVIDNNKITMIFTGDTVQTISIGSKDIHTDFVKDKEKPTAPTNLRALPAGTHEIVIVWEPSTDDRGVAGYNVYRNGTLIATTPYPVYADKKGLSLGVNYDYAVEAIDGAKNKSGQAFSQSVTTLSNPDTTPPPAISNLSATVNQDDVDMRWDLSQINDIARFVIKRGLQGMAKSELASITANTYNDFNLANGNYCYTVTAVDAAGNNSTESAERCALVNTGGTNTPPNTIVCKSYTEFTTATIDDDTTINAGCYKVNKDVYIEGGATLTVKPGVRMEFASGKQLTVRTDGALNAIGTATTPIIFTGTQSTPGYWKGITYYNSNNNKNELKYVTIEFGGGDADLNVDYGTRIKISNSIFRKSLKYGISFSSSSIIDKFSNNTITENKGAPLRIPADKLGVLDSSSSYAGNASNREYISVPDNENIVTDQTWKALNVPYKLDNISLKAVLTIAPSTVIIFKQGGNFRIEDDGTLIAKGTASKKITFTGENKTPGSWHGLQFTFSGTANELDHVIVDWAGGTNGNGNGAVTLFSTPGRLKIHNTAISNSLQYGLDIANSNHIIDISNVTFTNTEKGSVLVNPNILGKLDRNSTYNAPIIWASGYIDTEQTIKNLGVPYHVGAHRIQSSVSIEAGTTLSFAASGGFKVDGTAGSLAAIGTPSLPIIFTGRKSEPGYWKGLEFFTNSFSNKLDNTIIEYAGASGGNTQGLVGVFFNDSTVNISNSILRHSATNGLWLYDNTTGNHSGITFDDIEDRDIFIKNP